MKPLLALLAALLLAGCQATFWAQPPMPGGGCDPSAPGRWVTPPDPGQDNERLRLSIDGQCRLVAEKLAGGTGTTVSRSQAIPVRMARLGGQPYAWLDANALLAYEGVAHRTRDGDVMVYRYRIEGHQLRLWNINHAHVRGLIQQGRIAGELEDTEEDEFNRITGPVAPALLSQADFFEAAPTVLEREAGH